MSLKLAHLGSSSTRIASPLWGREPSAEPGTKRMIFTIDSSPGNLAPVFDAILQRAQTLCDAAYGSLMLYDGESFRAAAVYFVSEAFSERLREGFRVVDTPFAQRLLDRAGFVHVPDFAEVDHQIARAAVELTGVRTRLVVPLRKEMYCLVQSPPFAGKCGHFPTSRSRCCRTSLLRRPLRWRMRGS